MTDSEPAPYEFRDLASLMHDIAARCRLEAGAAHVALVRRVSTEQQVLHVERLRVPAEILDWEEPREELCRVVESWPEPQAPGRPEHTPVLVIVRPGLCVFGPNELLWSNAERYANFMASLWPAGLVLVTEHGWLDFMTNEAGSEPAMVPRLQSVPAS